MSNIPRSAHPTPGAPFASPFPGATYIRQVTQIPAGMVPYGYAPPVQPWPYGAFGPSHHPHSSPATPASASGSSAPSVLRPGPSQPSTQEFNPSHLESFTGSAPSSRRSSLAPVRSSPMHKPTSPHYLAKREAHKSADQERRKSLSHLLGDLADEVSGERRAGDSRLSKTSLIESSTRRLRAYRQAASNQEAENESLKQDNLWLKKHIEKLQQQLSGAGIEPAPFEYPLANGGEHGVAGGQNGGSPSQFSHMRRSSMPAHLQGPQMRQIETGHNVCPWGETPDVTSSWMTSQHIQQHDQSSPERPQSSHPESSPSLFTAHYSLASSPSMQPPAQPASSSGSPSFSSNGSMQGVSPPSQHGPGEYLSPSSLLDRRCSLPLDLSPLSSLSGNYTTPSAPGHPPSASGSVGSFVSTPSTAASAATPSSYVHGQSVDLNSSFSNANTFSDSKEVQTLLDLMTSLDGDESHAYQGVVNA